MKGKQFNITVGGVCMILLFAMILMMAMCPSVYAQTLVPCGSTYTAKAKGEKIKCVIPTPTPVPTAQPSPIPTPVPTPQPSPSPGVVCSKTVSQVGDAQASVNASVAGQTVCMEPGTYNFTVAFYPKSGVRIFCKPGAKLVFDGGSQEAPRFNTNVTGGILEGCEIVNGWDGVKVTGNNNIVRNNYIHDSIYMGILVTSSSGNILEGNRILNSGAGAKYISGFSPRHAHSIYFSNAAGYCVNMIGNKALNNILGPEAGVGVNFNGNECAKIGKYIIGTVVEGNEIINTNAGAALWYGTKDTVIKDNSFTILNPPASNMPESLKFAITVWGGAASEPSITGNTYNLKAGYGEFKSYP